LPHSSAFEFDFCVLNYSLGNIVICGQLAGGAAVLPWIASRSLPAIWA
jgi:hypothetical protein